MEHLSCDAYFIAITIFPIITQNKYFTDLKVSITQKYLMPTSLGIYKV